MLFHLSPARLVVALALGVLAGPARADIIMDVLIAGDASGTRLVTGEATESSVASTSQRVFGSHFDLVGGILTTDHPGFNAFKGSDLPAGLTPLPAGKSVQFNFLPMTINGTTSNLFYWNGSNLNSVQFTNVADGYALGAFGLTPPPPPRTPVSATVTGTPETVSGFILNNTDSEGKLHQHIDFSISNGTDSVAPGIYLVSLGLQMPSTGLADSDPFYLVFATPGFNEAAHDASIDWVNNNLAAVPEPSTVILSSLPLAVMGFLYVRRRYRGTAAFETTPTAA